jgi:hypothetical protein
MSTGILNFGKLPQTLLGLKAGHDQLLVKKLKVS